MCFIKGSEGNSLDFIEQFINSLPEDNRYEIFEAMVKREPEIQAILGDVEAPYGPEDVQRFYKDLKKQPDVCEKLASKIQDKYLKEDVADA